MRWYQAARWITATATFVGLAAMGCNDQSGSKSGTTQSRDHGSPPPGAEPMRAPDKMGGATNQKETSKSSSNSDGKHGSAKGAQAPQPKPVEQKAQAPKQPETAQTVVASEPKPIEPPPAQTPEQDLEKKRSQAEDMIYATIRVKMEEAISERATLLKQGVNPADERVRKLEGTIMRARSLLTENGEIVADVEPPIVEVQKP